MMTGRRESLWPIKKAPEHYGRLAVLCLSVSGRSASLSLYKIMGLTVYNTPADYKDLDELFFLNEVDSQDRSGSRQQERGRRKGSRYGRRGHTEP